MTRTLVCVITGGRPRLADRPSHRQFADLIAHGFTDIEWVVRADHADTYERDEHPLNTYTLAWAGDYARGHWQHPTAKWERNGFYGAAPGREWAMRTAEERGYDAVLQMDDNITYIGLITCTLITCRNALSAGAMMHLVSELSASTNVSMMGMQLNSAVPKGKMRTVRPGYPYSLFIEKCGPGRMPYYGPFEDDIMHALEYGLHGGPMRTAGLIEVMRYLKEHKSKTGMRQHYNANRGLEIARRYPNNVTLKVSRKSSGPKDHERGVRHILRTRGFTPVRVLDVPRYVAAEKAVQVATAQALRNKVEGDRAKIRKRAIQPTRETT